MCEAFQQSRMSGKGHTNLLTNRLRFVRPLIGAGYYTTVSLKTGLVHGKTLDTDIVGRGECLSCRPSLRKRSFKYQVAAALTAGHIK